VHIIIEDSNVSNITYNFNRNENYLHHHQLKVPTYYAHDWHTAQTWDMGCHISELLGTKIILLSAQRRLLQPSSQVAKTSVVHVHGTADYAPSSGLCSNTSATLTEAGTGSCLLEDGNQNNREQQSVARN